MNLYKRIFGVTNCRMPAWMRKRRRMQFQSGLHWFPLPKSMQLSMWWKCRLFHQEPSSCMQLSQGRHFESWRFRSSIKSQLKLQNYFGNPSISCKPECYGDVDCPAGRPACFYGICKNPCDGVCGVGADCKLRGLTPICSCPKDMTGDPFVSCRPFDSRKLRIKTLFSSRNAF